MHRHRCKSSTSPNALNLRRDGGLIYKASHEMLELRAEIETDAPPGALSGYGSKFGLVDSYNETIKPGAFKASLREWKKSKMPIPMLWQHYGDVPIGVWTKFEEDEVGLKLEGQLILEIPQAAQALAAIKAKAVTGLSIGYMEVDADPWWDPEREGPREVRKLDLRETSVVTFPALREAQLDAVKARVARGERPSLREFERHIQRELGLSRSQAAEIADRGYKDWITREGGPEAFDDAPQVLRDISQSLESLHTPLFSP